MQIRSILTPLRGYTSSGPAGHLPLKGKALGAVRLNDKPEFEFPSGVKILFFTQKIKRKS
jgi:hypothetical protein